MAPACQKKKQEGQVWRAWRVGMRLCLLVYIPYEWTLTYRNFFLSFSCLFLDHKRAREDGEDPKGGRRAMLSLSCSLSCPLPVKLDQIYNRAHIKHAHTLTSNQSLGHTADKFLCRYIHRHTIVDRENERKASSNKNEQTNGPNFSLFAAREFLTFTGKKHLSQTEISVYIQFTRYLLT